jgi:hypothetical protein
MSLFCDRNMCIGFILQPIIMNIGSILRPIMPRALIRPHAKKGHGAAPKGHTQRRSATD